MKLKEISSPVRDTKAYYTNNNLSVICGMEPVGPEGAKRWHLSVAHKKRNPTWEEIRELRYMLIPDAVTMVMFLPPSDQYVNEHKYCFHLFELDEVPGLIAPFAK